MSEVTPTHDHDAPHEGPIKTPKQLVLAIVFAFLVPIVAITLLVSFVASEKRHAAGSDALSARPTAERISPVGTVEVKDVSDPSSLKSGEQVFGAVCVACHGTGNLGAPKLGDTAAWAPRLPQGFDTLVQHALKGKGAMPAQGGGDFADVEVARAVAYMANKSGAKFEEPKAPAAGASAPAAGATVAAAPAPAAAASPATAATTVATAAPAAAATTAAAPQATAAAGPPPLYAQTCSVCHATGVAGAPKLGDKAAWAPRVAQGVDGLTASAIKGKGAMPPKGGSSASDAEIKGVVEYMVSQAK
jgi:cytochrome c5